MQIKLTKKAVKNPVTHKWTKGASGFYVSYYRGRWQRELCISAGFFFIRIDFSKKVS